MSSSELQLLAPEGSDPCMRAALCFAGARGLLRALENENLHTHRVRPVPNRPH